MRIGFIGLGRMGSGLAGSLLQAGYELSVYDVNPQAMAALQQRGAIVASDSLALARSVNVLFTSLPMPADVEAVLAGERSCFAALPKDATAIDVSTIDPQTASALTRDAERHGVHFLACPLGKGPAQAAEASEPIFAGGPHDIFLHHRSLLEAIGKPVYYLGGVEQSTAFKLISNLIGMANVAILAEGLALGVKAGLDLAQLVELLADTGADSYQLHLRGTMMRDADYAPRFSVDLTAKDLGLAASMTRALGREAVLSSTVLQLFQEAQAWRMGNEDAAAVYKVLAERYEKH